MVEYLDTVPNNEPASASATRAGRKGSEDEIILRHSDE